MRARPVAAILIPCLAILCLLLPPEARAQEVDLGIITVKDRGLAQKIVQRLQKGESFESLARAYSVGAAASRGGRIGRAPLKKLRKDYREAIKDLAPGKPSAIVPTEEGFSVLMVFGKPKAAPAQDNGEEQFLLARQEMMMGIESLAAGALNQGRKHFSQALGHNPRQDSAPFFMNMASGVRSGKYSAKAVSIFAEGFLTMSRGEVSQARDLFRKAFRADPRLWQAELFEANMLGGLGQKNQAAAMWREVLRKNPRAALAYVSLGLAAREKRRDAEARKLFHKALAINPDQAQANYNLGNMALYEGKFKEAERYLRAAIAADPFVDESHSDLGLAYAYTGRFKDAEKCYLKALEVNPAYAPAHVNLGTLYAQRKQYNLAIDEFNKALQIDPRLGDAHSNLAAAYILQEDWPNAIRHADTALQLNYPVPKQILRALEPHRRARKK